MCAHTGVCRVCGLGEPPPPAILDVCTRERVASSTQISQQALNLCGVCVCVIAASMACNSSACVFLVSADFFPSFFFYSSSSSSLTDDDGGVLQSSTKILKRVRGFPRVHNYNCCRANRDFKKNGGCKFMHSLELLPQAISLHFFIQFV